MNIQTPKKQYTFQHHRSIRGNRNDTLLHNLSYYNSTFILFPIQHIWPLYIVNAYSFSIWSSIKYYQGRRRTNSKGFVFVNDFIHWTNGTLYDWSHYMWGYKSLYISDILLMRKLVAMETNFDQMLHSLFLLEAD